MPRTVVVTQPLCSRCARHRTVVARDAGIVAEWCVSDLGDLPRTCRYEITECDLFLARADRSINADDAWVYDGQGFQESNTVVWNRRMREAQEAARQGRERKPAGLHGFVTGENE